MISSPPPAVAALARLSQLKARCNRTTVGWAFCSTSLRSFAGFQRRRSSRTVRNADAVMNHSPTAAPTSPAGSLYLRSTSLPCMSSSWRTTDNLTRQMIRIHNLAPPLRRDVVHGSVSSVRIAWHF